MSRKMNENQRNKSIVVQNFLFRFGYCTPVQWDSNRTHGWDDESSSAFFVYADNAEDALSWGCEVAERYVRHQFEKARWTEIPSWKEAQFAFWIDETPTVEFSPEGLGELPKVMFKQVPDFRDWE